MNPARYLVPIALFAIGCTKSVDSPSSADLPNFDDVSTAPAAIQKAAKAVVRIETAGALATGSFISATGLLLTNNHVLGVGVCPIEGCSVQITFMHQRGQTSSDQSVFAVPVAVDVGLDMAVVQLSSAPGGSPLETPDFLSFDSRDPASLLGTHVTIVGHPEGTLKKWTDGVVYDSSGDWFESTAYILPGDSGSPVLDDQGNIVGLIHRAPVASDLVTSDSVNFYSIGTASAALVAAMSAPLPSVMISTQAPATAAEVVANDFVYLNGRAPTVLVDGVETSVLSLLGQACDAALARTDFQSPEDLSQALSPCVDALVWIECRTDAAPLPYGVVCPPDAADWANRFQAVNQLWVAMNGSTYLYSVAYGIAELATSEAAGLASGSQSLLQALSSAHQLLDFDTASYLAAFGVAAYDGTNTVNFIRDFKKVPHYEYAASSIATAALWLVVRGSMQRDEAFRILSELDSDPNVDIGSKLYIEDAQYNWMAP